MEVKVKNIDIIIESEDEFFQRAERIFTDLDHNIIPSEVVERLSFDNLDQLRQVITKKRLELLHVIKHHHPKSIYALAKITNRDITNIRDDLSKLEVLGLVEMVQDTSDPRAPLIPNIKYDKLLVSIEL